MSSRRVVVRWTYCNKPSINLFQCSTHLKKSPVNMEMTVAPAAFCLVSSIMVLKDAKFSLCQRKTSWVKRRICFSLQVYSFTRYTYSVYTSVIWQIMSRHSPSSSGSGSQVWLEGSNLSGWDGCRPPKRFASWTANPLHDGMRRRDKIVPTRPAAHAADLFLMPVGPTANRFNFIMVKNRFLRIRQTQVPINNEIDICAQNRRAEIPPTAIRLTATKFPLFVIDQMVGFSTFCCQVPYLSFGGYLSLEVEVRKLHLSTAFVTWPDVCLRSSFSQKLVAQTRALGLTSCFHVMKDSHFYWQWVSVCESSPNTLRQILLT